MTQMDLCFMFVHHVHKRQLMIALVISFFLVDGKEN